LEDRRIFGASSCYSVDGTGQRVQSLRIMIMPLRGPDMSLDIRLLDVSIETPDSEGSESMAVGLSIPHG